MTIGQIIFCIIASAVLVLRFYVWRTRDDLLCRDCKWFKKDAWRDCQNPRLGIRRDTGEVNSEWASLMRERMWAGVGKCGASGSWWEAKEGAPAPIEKAAIKIDRVYLRYGKRMQ